MKKLCIVVALLFFTILSTTGYAQKPEDYEKFGRVAISVVKEDYPGTPVKDYEYEGRKKLSDTQIADSFKFKVAEDGTQKEVLVTVVHDPNNEKIININVEEVRSN